MKPFDYVIRLHDDPAQIDAAAWNDLVGQSEQANPFVSHEYLLALHSSGSATPATGWVPQFVTVWVGHVLHAASPLYIKSHSYGEYVFDWSWADAHERHGLKYYPKLLCSSPFTPVPGPRLLARNQVARQVLLRAIEALAYDSGLSSAHILFLDQEDLVAIQQQGWMLRSGVQFHWQNRHLAPYTTFDDFLSQLHREKRKKIKQERRHIREAGVSFSTMQGTDIRHADWDFFHDCYCNTYRAHHSVPYLSRDFFRQVAATMPENWVLFVAQRHGRPIASSLIAVDPAKRRAYGRYWGSVEHVPYLHFEACYYEPLQWCIEHCYLAFEGGAQGEHKMARGLLPQRTWSAHWLRHTAFASAVEQFLRREGNGIEAYVNELNERNPFKIPQ